VSPVEQSTFKSSSLVSAIPEKRTLATAISDSKRDKREKRSEVNDSPKDSGNLDDNASQELDPRPENEMKEIQQEQHAKDKQQEIEQDTQLLNQQLLNNNSKSSDGAYREFITKIREMEGKISLLQDMDKRQLVNAQNQLLRLLTTITNALVRKV
jgi:hypothetical protein